MSFYGADLLTFRRTESGSYFAMGPSGGAWTIEKDGTTWRVDSPTERGVDQLATLASAKRAAQRLARKRAWTK